MYATGYVTVGGERRAVGIPANSLRQEATLDTGDDSGEEADKQSIVWRVKNGMVEKLVVRSGLSDGDLVEIIDSVVEGDQIVTSSPASLKPGIAVQVHETTLPSAKEPAKDAEKESAKTAEAAAAKNAPVGKKAPAKAGAK
jgi:hypothetical protein